jgi:hypothetical protein
MAEHTQPQLVRVGNNFINLNNLLWAELRHGSGENQGKPLLTLVYGYRDDQSGRMTLSLNFEDSAVMLKFLDQISVRATQSFIPT